MKDVQTTKAPSSEPHFISNIDDISVPPTPPPPPTPSQQSFDQLVTDKITQFLSHLGGHYPKDLYKLLMAKMEKPMIAEVLRHTGGNQLQAAKILGINRGTLARKVQLHNIPIKTDPRT